MSEKTQKIQKYKSDAVDKIKIMVQGASDIIFADYRGLSVEQITNLRGKLAENAAELRVVKNNFTKIALQELKMPDVGDSLFGPTAIALIKKDSGPVAKAMVEFAKDLPLELKGGIVGGQFFNNEQITALSKLPGREQLLASLMGTMNAPLKNMMYAMNGVIEKLVRTVKAVADQKNNN
ncbi:MAG: 50S ribosomal protein L10 [Spirochaetales bacterium]|nr:50S ribosomal protein L10 [Spirochaetales bacterium]